jgi:hypothetical protein
VRSVSGDAQPALALQVPLLRRRGRDGAEAPLPRPQPRVTAAKLAQQLEAALDALAAEEGGGGGGTGGGGAGGSGVQAAPWEAVQGVAWGGAAAQPRQQGA